MHSLSTFLIFIGFLGFLGCRFQNCKGKIENTFQNEGDFDRHSYICFNQDHMFSFMKAYFDWYYWLPRVFFCRDSLLFIEFCSVKEKGS